MNLSPALTTSGKVKQTFLCNFYKSLKAIAKRIEDATYSEIYKENLPIDDEDCMVCAWKTH